MFLIEYWIRVQAYTGTVDRSDLFHFKADTIRIGAIKKLALVQANTYEEALAKLKMSLKATEELVDDRTKNLTIA